MRKFCILSAAFAMLLTAGYSQKIKVGYDKTADFSKYKSYTLVEPKTPSTRPLLYESVVGTVRQGLESKGLANKVTGGDLTIVPSGGFDYGLSTDSTPTADSCNNCKAPIADPQAWVGTTAPAGVGGAPRPRGTLELDFVDSATNKVVWSGAVSQKLNPDKKSQALEKIGNAIQKLLDEYPPKK